MGVKGLWSLLSPVARPIKLETLEGKRMAIDSSIWLYQFQATMRDKEGRVLVNAHVLGFLRRINKLLFHGIKPVFVFDGGAPNLKRSTIAERKRKKAGAAANHAKVAEKLFAAQMRREAVKQAQAARERQQVNAAKTGQAEYGYQPEAGEAIPEGASYLEELEDEGPARMDRDHTTPAKRPVLRTASGSGSRPGESPMSEQDTSPSAGRGVPTAEELAEKKRKNFRKHDPYRLPQLPDNAFRPPVAGSSKAGPSGGPRGRASKLDPRLATEEELQHFIEEMRPEDLDFDSPEFHSLPTEIQYEIIGDLRIRSRQQSHKRLASMLQKAPTPLDFSKAQIAQLSQRNVLTQRLLTVTDSIGNSGLQIPVRVASERNREYVLVRNSEADGGGWVLGVRDQGTETAPIVVEESPRKKPQRARIVDGVLRREKRKHGSDSEMEQDEKEEDEDDEVVPVPFPMDPDLRASRQKEFLDAIARRHTPQKATGKKAYDEIIKANPKQKQSVPLFAEDPIEGEDAPEQQNEEEEDLEEVQVAEAHPITIDDEDMNMDGIDQGGAPDASSDFEEIDIPVPDVALHAVISETAQEALRRREEEDRALLAALRASKSDARLHFDAAERDASIAETRSTMTDPSIRDFESDTESMEEVPVKPDSNTKLREPFSEVSPFFTGRPVDSSTVKPTDSSQPKPKDAVTHSMDNAVSAKDFAVLESPALHTNGLLAVEEPLMVSNGLLPLEEPLIVSNGLLDLPAEQSTPRPKQRSDTGEMAATPVAQAITARATTHLVSPGATTSVNRIAVQALSSATPTKKADADSGEAHTPMPKVDRQVRLISDEKPTTKVGKQITSAGPIITTPRNLAVTPIRNDASPKETQQQVPVSSGNRPVYMPQTLHRTEPAESGQELSPPIETVQPELMEEIKKTSNRAQTSMPKADVPATSISTPPEDDADMEWEASPPPESREMARTVPKSLSDVQQQDNFDRTLLRASKDPEEEVLDDSLSMNGDTDSDDGLSEHERAEHRQGLFAAPPADLEEDEGGVDMNAEGDDYARFLSQIKGRNLTEVRQEIDNEIRTLNQQNKVAMRDSEEITHQMIAQIQLMLRLFGIPYITAPMEAEAQCAELARLDLVDGVITDDNDVFLFGGTQCFKNLFNDAKYVECFIAHDLDRELSLNRDRLISLAYLLGSDYTIGLPGVGPVVAMELMAEFPGPRGLEDFKRWWLDVQMGKDDVASQSKFRKTFKKKFTNVIHIDPSWPNPLVREAYHRPEVETSDEPFHWGFPDLNGLRGFLRSELSWSVSKVDDELTPIVQRIARRGQAGSMNKQTILDPFFDASLGKGMFAPRLRTKYPSKRLQAVIKMFREAEARIRGVNVPEGFGEMLADLEDEPLREVDANEAIRPDEVQPNPTAAKVKTPAVKRKRGATVEGDENAAPPKKRAPRKRKTQDSEITGDRADSETPDTRSRASSDASMRGKKVKAARGGARGSRRRNQSTRSETIDQAAPAEGEVEIPENNVTGMQPVSSPFTDQGYDQLFLEIASDPIGPDDIAPIRPRPKQRQA